MFNDARQRANAVAPRVRRLLAQISRFVIVGGLAFGLDAGILAVLVAAGVTPFAGRIVSISLTIVFTWLMNRRHTFAVQAAPTWSEFAAYVAISLAGALINYVAFSVGLLLGVPMLAALAIGTLSGMAFNFIRYRALMNAR